MAGWVCLAVGGLAAWGFLVFMGWGHWVLDPGLGGMVLEGLCCGRVAFLTQLGGGRLALLGFGLLGRSVFLGC